MRTYIPSGEQERLEMLKAIGVNSPDELYSAVPQNMKIKKLNLPQGMSELELKREFKETASENTVYKSVFRGAGAYCHYIPSIVKSVVNKEEFVTAYTPYQAEISQGILQSIFEYQTMICSLTGMDVSNASVYDGASAAAEAAAMCRDRKRGRIVITDTLNPMVAKTIGTYCFGSGAELVVIPSVNGITDTEVLKKALDETSACFIMQQPNRNGILEDAGALGEITHNAGAKFVMSVYPVSLGVLKSPAEYGADIAVGEGQPLGMPLGFGGPYLGFMAAKQEMMRKLPGRIVGETADKDGNRAFVLTLQAREQHIRREKASSNICSNEALCALTASVYLTAMGEKGLEQVATLCTSKAHYLADRLDEIGFKKVYDAPFFNEFLTKAPCKVEKALEALDKKGILGGLPVGENILWCATEMNTAADIDSLITALKEVC